MFEKTDTKITRYVDGPWFIDIVRGFSEGIYLGHEDYGVVKFLFGMEPGFTDEQFFRYIGNEIEFHKSAYAAEFFDHEKWDEDEQAAFDKFTEEEYIKHLWSEETQEVFDQFTEEELRKKRMRSDDDDDLPFY